MINLIYALHVPVRPPQPQASASALSPVDGGELTGEDGPICQPCDVEDSGLDADGDDVRAQRPRALPGVPVPSAAEVARHNLTHIPLRSWCRICVMCRRHNLPHRRLPPFDRSLPLFVLDYCVVRDSRGEDLLTLCVGRLYPYRAIFATRVDEKGANSYAVKRMGACFPRVGRGKTDVYVCSRKLD